LAGWAVRGSNPTRPRDMESERRPAQIAAMIIAASFDEAEPEPPRPFVSSDGHLLAEGGVVQNQIDAPKPVRVAARRHGDGIQVALDGSSWLPYHRSLGSIIEWQENLGRFDWVPRGLPSGATLGCFGSRRELRVSVGDFRTCLRQFAFDFPWGFAADSVPSTGTRPAGLSARESGQTSGRGCNTRWWRAR
jgi:hypothetical protein